MAVPDDVRELEERIFAHKLTGLAAEHQRSYVRTTAAASANGLTSTAHVNSLREARVSFLRDKCAALFDSLVEACSRRTTSPTDADYARALSRIRLHTSGSVKSIIQEVERAAEQAGFSPALSKKIWRDSIGRDVSAIEGEWTQRIEIERRTIKSSAGAKANMDAQVVTIQGPVVNSSIVVQGRESSAVVMFETASQAIEQSEAADPDKSEARTLWERVKANKLLTECLSAATRAVIEGATKSIVGK